MSLRGYVALFPEWLQAGTQTGSLPGRNNLKEKPVLDVLIYMPCGKASDGMSHLGDFHCHGIISWKEAKKEEGKFIL